MVRKGGLCKTALSESRKKANKKWDKENLRQFAIYLNKTKDAEVIAKLESVENRTNYIRELIKQDLANK